MAIKLVSKLTMNIIYDQSIKVGKRTRKSLQRNTYTPDLHSSYANPTPSPPVAISDQFPMYANVCDRNLVIPDQNDNISQPLSASRRLEYGVPLRTYIPIASRAPNYANLRLGIGHHPGRCQGRGSFEIGRQNRSSKPSPGDMGKKTRPSTGLDQSRARTSETSLTML
ncbi:hypothetical protein CEXT_809801 [Caerostris extrusa]|uniref:Uncharacterized protein n=1 Tax=Caerostris extrusa TaxID=172846 RepID=A0AAV4WX67_CAEEX|nr:hypothetical protein CEXT_809801 [Caerostris extrusa]